MSTKLPLTINAGNLEELSLDDSLKARLALHSINDTDAGANTLYYSLDAGEIVYKNPLGVVESIVGGGSVFTDTDDIPEGIENKYLNKEALKEIAYDNYMLTDLNSQSADAIDDRIEGVTGGSSSQDIFTSRNTSTNTYVRNTGNFVADIDLTCISAGVSSGIARNGTLISPRHVLLAAHAGTGTGYTIDFVTSDNVTHTRTVTANETITGTDILIGVLDSDLPDTISYAKVMDPKTLAQLSAPVDGRFVPVLYSNRNFVLNITELEPMTEADTYVSFDSSDEAKRLEFWASIEIGDSGKGSFIISDGELILLGAFHYGSQGSSPSVSYYIDEINTAMSNLGGGYQLDQRFFRLLPITINYLTNGSASATNNGIVRFDGDSGYAIKDSAAFLDDDGNLTAKSLRVDDSGKIVIGASNASISSGTGLAIGAGVTAANGGTAIGYTAVQATAANALAVGAANVTASGIYSTAIGIFADATNTVDIAIGAAVSSSGGNSVAIGQSVAVTGNKSVIIGHGVSGTVTNATDNTLLLVLENTTLQMSSTSILSSFGHEMAANGDFTITGDITANNLGTAAATDSADYATSAQGGLADTAVQPSDLTPYELTTSVDTKLAALVDSSPEALDTLNELAAALGDDANFSTTVNANIAAKLAKALNLSDLTDATAARTNLGLGTAATTDASAYATAAQGALADTSMQKVTTTDNAIMTADGTSGAVQSSLTKIDDAGDIIMPTQFFSIGYDNTATGNSLIIGTGNEVSGGIAIGRNIDGSGTSIGSNCEAGSSGAAIGVGSTSTGVFSAALGSTVTASGTYSAAVGTQVSATGTASFASGVLSYATNDNTFAFGLAANVSGSYSGVVGYQMTVTADNAMSIGISSSGAHTNSTADSILLYNNGTSFNLTPTGAALSYGQALNADGSIFLPTVTATPTTPVAGGTIFVENNTLNYMDTAGVTTSLLDGGVSESEVTAIAAGSTLGLQQSLLANAGQPGLTVLAVGQTNTGKVQGTSLGDGNVVEVYANGTDFNAGTVLYREFMSLGEPIVFTGLSNGAIITSTQGFYGMSENFLGSSESPMPLLSYGLSFKSTFLFAFRNSLIYSTTPGAVNNAGRINVVNGPLSSILKFTDALGVTVRGQENIALEPWEFIQLNTAGNIEYIVESTNPVMACVYADDGFYDMRLVMPLTNDGITWPKSGFVSAPYDNTQVEFFTRDNVTGFLNSTLGTGVSPGSPVDFDAAVGVGTGASDADYEPNGATRVLATGLISAYSGADGAGFEATPLMPTSAMSQVIAQPQSIQDSGDGGNSGIAIASPYEGTAKIYEWNDTTKALDLAYTIPLTRNGVTVTSKQNQKHPASGGLMNNVLAGVVPIVGNLAPGVIIADVPITVIIQSDTSVQTTIRSQNGLTATTIINEDDETLMLGVTPSSLKAEITEGADGILYKRVITGGTETWEIA